MPVLVSLLRGVNIVGRNSIRMEALRALYESLGMRDVATCLQSGNVVFRSSGRSPERIRLRIETAIEKTFGIRPFVMLRSLDELEATEAQNPFAKRITGKPEGSKLAVYFLRDVPAEEDKARFRSLAEGGELVEFVGREAYVYFANGMGWSKLFRANIEKILNTRATARNINTVRKLVEIGQRIAGRNSLKQPFVPRILARP